MKSLFSINNLQIAPLLTLLLILIANIDAQKIFASRDKDGEKILSVVKAQPNLPTKIETGGAGKSTLKISADKAFKAYVLCVPAGSPDTDNCASRVFFTDMVTKSVYEIRGEETLYETGRPVDELKWINNHTLSYERWVGPHGGERYVVEVRSRKPTAAFFLSDQR